MPFASAKSLLKSHLQSFLPQRIRSFRQFAEEEIILPNGPRAGMKFRCDLMPWTGMVLDEFSARRCRRFFGSGPVQSGKTLLFFVIPCLYHLFETNEPVIVGVPKIDLAQSIYEERLLPAILKSRYAALLPRKGSGSRGGRFLSLCFQNGAILRFMGAGGDDAQRSSHTARVVVLTEIDKMDRPGAASREADPVNQLEARTKAYGSLARLYAECTMSTPEGRVYQEVVKIGTHTRVHVPCPHCGEYIYPLRDQFTGWREAQNVVDARAGATYRCQACQTCWSEDDRAEALRNPVLVSEGQTVSSDGEVTGDVVPTNTWGFRWNAMHNALVSMADVAEAEFRAEHSENPGDRKALMQFTWAEAYEDENLVHLSALDADLVLARIGSHPRGVAPADASLLTVFIDLGLYRCWWAACAWKPQMIGYVIDYGVIDVPQGRQANRLSILTSLRSFRDEVLRAGWITESDAPIFPKFCLVDSGWENELVYNFVMESGQPPYMACKGLGSRRNQSAWHAMKPARGVWTGGNWFITKQPNGIHLVHIHSDHWKKRVHEGFGAAPGNPNSIQLFRGERHDHATFARQIIAERQEEEYEPGKGIRVYWNSVHRDNHYLDCLAGCMAAADILGIRLAHSAPPPPQEPEPSARYEDDDEDRPGYRNWIGVRRNPGPWLPKLDGDHWIR